LDTDENRVAAFAIKLLLLTGARRNEITHAKWEHVNWDKRTLLVPRAKSGRPRSIHLNSAALDLLRAIERTDGNPFIFPSPVTGRPSPSLHFPWWRIRERAGLLDVRLQGLLGHTQARTTQRYAHLANDTLADAAEVVRDVILEPAGEEAAFRSQRT